MSQLEPYDQMTKSISDEEFEIASKDIDNIRIIKSACKRYRDILSEDTLETCGLNALWECLLKHDDNLGSKFTTSLYQFVIWECKEQVKRLNSINEIPCEYDVSDDSISVLDRMIAHEYMNMLPANRKQILYSYYFEGKNCAEIAREMDCSRENVRQILGRTISYLQNVDIG